MKKTIIATFTMSLLLLCGCSTMYNVTDYEVKKLTITENSTVVYFGDSLTYGHGADSATESWPAILQNNISIPVINSGKNDDTTLDCLNRFQTDVLDHNPAILIIDFGGNDIYNFSKKQSYSEIENNFKAMLDQLDPTKTQFYIMRFFNDEMKFLDLFGSFDKILKRLEKEYDVIIIWDAWKGDWGHKDCKYDMTHCNVKGYKIMSQNILSVLEPCLKENGIFVEAD